MSDFGKRIKEARKRAKLTQEQLAKRVGMSQSNLSDLEREGEASTYTVQMAQECGVNPNWLATGVGLSPVRRKTLFL